MPKLVHSTPKYRRHKASGQAVVTIKGKDHYLGPWRSKASKVEYDRLIGEWLASGRQSPVEIDDDGFTVMELAAAYLKYAKGYYRKDGHPTGSMDRVRAVLRALKEVYGYSQVTSFGPLALQAIQKQLVDAGKSRRYINYLTEGIKRVFKWGVSQELLPVAVHQALMTVPGLKKGRTEAREPERIKPIEDSIVDLTLPHVPAVVADMVRLQRLTGARPAEICILRPCDVNRTEEVWSYKPESHKTEHHGKERVIFIGPRGQEILLPYLLRDAESCCFCPADSEDEHNARRRAERRSPMTPSQAKRRRKRRPQRAPGDCYSVNTYRQAIQRACDKADVKAHEMQPEVKADKRIVPRWAPNRLRHTAGTEIRAKYGLEAVQVVLGHSRADVTQVYAERDLAKAAAVMKEVG